MHTSQLAYIWEIQFTELRQRFSHPQSLYYRKSNTKSKGGDITDVLAAGLPNILGELDWTNAGANYTGMEITNNLVKSSGALQTTKNKKSQIIPDTPYTGDLIGNIIIDASQSSSLFGNSDTVQPPAFSLLPQIKF